MPCAPSICASMRERSSPCWAHRAPGKTTLLNVIGCILAPTAGRVELDGDAVFDGKWLRSDLRRLRLDKIGFIFQAHNLLPFLTAEENVSVVLDLAGWPRPRAAPVRANLLDYLEVGHRAKVKPALLSGERRSVLPSPARWPTGPASFWPMNRPPPWTVGGRNL
jgi:predicted ABC-type transport system involved in lysophospholipase L1 biosynthesis ATPase subunit